MSTTEQGTGNPTDVFIHTSLLTGTGRQQFGPPGAMDYRSHPGDGNEDDPTVVYRSMLSSEVPPLPSLDVMKKTIYSFKNRKIISRWLRDVCSAFRLRSTTLCLSIQLTDAFLLGSLQVLKVDRCQLAAVTCLWIAAKFEEMDPDLPSLRKIVDVCDGAYTAAEVLDLEEAVLRHFKWCLPHATVVNHLYLQVHMLGREEVVKRAPQPNLGKKLRVSVLLDGAQSRQRSWSEAIVDGTATLKEVLPRLCSASHIPLTSSLEVYQLFGADFILAQSLDQDTALSTLSLDGVSNEMRLYISSMRGQAASIFANHGSLKILRAINYSFLDLCDFLTQEVVIHVEFLRLASHVNAAGVLGLALCLSASTLAGARESKPALRHIFDALGISASQSLAAADLLRVKYEETVAAMPQPHHLPTPPPDIRERLSVSFDRPLALGNSAADQPDAA